MYREGIRRVEANKLAISLRVLLFFLIPLSLGRLVSCHPEPLGLITGFNKALVTVNFL